MILIVLVYLFDRIVKTIPDDEGQEGTKAIEYRYYGNLDAAMDPALYIISSFLDV